MEIKKEYYTNGKLAAITVLSNGKKQGLCQDFCFKTGRLSSCTEYLDDNEQSRIYRHFYPSGTLYLEMPMRQKKRHGIVKTWSEEGVLIQISEYKNDILQGIDRRFYPNGQKKAEIEFHQDMISGFYREWNEAGELTYSQLYENGRPFKPSANPLFFFGLRGRGGAPWWPRRPCALFLNLAFSHLPPLKN